MNTTTFGILNFLINIAKLEPYQSLVFLSTPNSDRTFDDGDLSLIELVSKATAVPVIISHNYTSSINVTSNFNSELLTIVDLQTKLYPEILARIRQLFEFTAKVRVLLVLDHDAPSSKFLQSLFHLCWKNKLLNVIAVSRDFARTNDIYGYIPYPALQIEKRRYSLDTIFPDHLKDLKGTFLKVFADQVPPRDMMTLKPNGEIYLSGFAGHIINAFTRKHNAKLNFSLPYKLGKSVYSAHLKELFLNDTIDLLVSLVVINTPSAAHSYPVEQTSYCLMLPVERAIPTAQIYRIVLQPTVIFTEYAICSILSALLVTAIHYIDDRGEFRIVDIFLSVTAIQATASQSFRFVKTSSVTSRLAYILMSWLGVFCSTWYFAYLKTYLTQTPPMPRKVESFADLYWAGYKVLIFWRENDEALEKTKQAFDESVSQVTQNLTEYLTALNHLDTSYSYMIPTSKWNTVKEQQKLFATPMFRTSNICTLKGIPMGFPMHPNSVLKDALNRVILQVTDAGLLRYWMDRTFPEMVTIGHLTYADWSVPQQMFKPLEAKDLTFVLMTVSFCFLLATLMLMGELSVYKAGRMLEGRKRAKMDHLQSHYSAGDCRTSYSSNLY